MVLDAPVAAAWAEGRAMTLEQAIEYALTATDESKNAVAEAAVVGVEHSKWQERPIACVVVKAGQSVSKEEVIAHLKGKFASWWMPDDVVFIDEVPKTSVGKFDKRVLRERYAGYLARERGP